VDSNTDELSASAKRKWSWSTNAPWVRSATTVTPTALDRSLYFHPDNPPIETTDSYYRHSPITHALSLNWRPRRRVDLPPSTRTWERCILSSVGPSLFGLMSHLRFRPMMLRRSSDGNSHLSTSAKRTDSRLVGVRLRGASGIASGLCQQLELCWPTNSYLLTPTWRVLSARDRPGSASATPRARPSSISLPTKMPIGLGKLAAILHAQSPVQGGNSYTLQ